MPVLRTWARRLLVGALLLAGLYLAGVNLFLNTPLGPWAVNRRPQRLHLTWRSAWSLLPGRVSVRGLTVGGASRRVAWSIAVDRGRGAIGLAQLFRRRFELDGFHGEGVRFAVAQTAPTAAAQASAPARPVVARPGRRRGWSVQLRGIDLSDVREIQLYQTHITGPAHVRGDLAIAPGGVLRLNHATLQMPAGRLLRGDEVLVEKLDLQATARIASYSVGRFPGMRGLDFVSGSLRAAGTVPHPPLRRQSAGLPAPGPLALAAALHVVGGRLAPGSHLTLLPASPASPSAAAAGGTAGTLALQGAVVADLSQPRLVISARATGLAIGGGADRPPLLASDVLELQAATPELRFSHLLAAIRTIGRTRTLPPGAVAGDVRAEGLRLGSARGRVSWAVQLDRARGAIDLPALLARRLVLDRVEAEGAAVRLQLNPGPPPERRAGPPPWAVEVLDARFSGLREVALGENVLTGPGKGEVSFSWGPPAAPLGRGAESGPPSLEIRRVALDVSSAELRIAGQPAAQRVRLGIEGRMAPLVPGQVQGRQILRLFSGTAALAGEVSSLAFLNDVFRRAPWFHVRGSGRLAADVRFAEGRLLAGTRLSVVAPRIEARILDAHATGSGEVEATVAAPVGDKRQGPRAEVRVVLDRFRIAERETARAATFLRGRGLRLTASSAKLDLAGNAFADVRAELRLRNAEVPDLRVYNAYLPAGTGVEITSGRGLLGLHLALDAASGTGKGEAALTSDSLAARFQDVDLAGRLDLSAVLASRDLAARRFDLAGSRLALDGISYREAGEKESAEAAVERSGWWARLALERGAVTWGKPLSLRGTAAVEMRDAGPVLALFAQRRRFLHWFADLMHIENVRARGELAVGDGAVAVDGLRATGGKLDLRARLRLAAARKTGDLFVRYGRFATAIELRDGRRTFHLRRPEQWYESGGR